MSNVENLSSNFLRIGVTGHRFLAEMDKISQSIDFVCQVLIELYPGRPWQIISPLAEGADRLVATKMIGHNARLLVPLPLPVKDYLEDFISTESQQEFLNLLQQAAHVIELSPQKNRGDAYDQVGYYVVNHSDVLIAIWDGNAAQGQGGTGEFVTLARQQKIPVVWIHAGNRKPGTTEATSLGSDQGKVDFFNFPDQCP